MRRGVFWVVLAVVMLVPRVVLGVDLLFVFHSNPTVSIYDAGTLDLLATPTVGMGAVHAIGVPNPETPTELLKIYVIMEETVAVLAPDPPFEVVTTLPLPASLNLGERSALLTHDGRRLLVANGVFVSAFDALASDNPLGTELNMSGQVQGLCVLPNSERAYVITAGSTEIQIIGLTSVLPQRLAGPIPLALQPTVLGAAPNSNALYAGFSGSLLEIDQATARIRATIPVGAAGVDGLIFDPDAPVANAFLRQGGGINVIDLELQEVTSSLFPPRVPVEILTPGQGVVYTRGGGSFQRGIVEAGDTVILEDPRTGEPFTVPAVDMEAASGGQEVFLAFGGEGSVVVLDALGNVFLRDLVSPATLMGIALVSTPAAFPSVLEVYGGNNQFGSADVTLTKPLAVRALGPDFKPAQGSVSFTSDRPATFRPPVAKLNLQGVAETRVTPSTTDPFEIEGIVTPGNFRTVFSVNSGAEDADGLVRSGGDNQITLETTPFPMPFQVQALSSGLPIVGLELEISTGTDVVCPPTVRTGAGGTAAFSCSAADVENNTNATVSVRDSFGRSLTGGFSVRIVTDPNDLPVAPRNLGPPRISGTVGSRLAGALQFQVITGMGAEVPGVGATFAATGDLAFDPAVTVSSPLGLFSSDVIFGCDPGTQTISVSLHSPGAPTSSVVATTDLGAATTITKIQGDNLSGVPGERLAGPGQALRILVTDDCGNAIGREELTWEVNPPNAATLDQATARTTPQGQASAIVVLGDDPGVVTVTVRAGAAEASFSILINPVAASAAAIQGDAQEIPLAAAAPVPLVAQFSDTNGSPVPDLAVEFAVTSGEGQVTSPLVSTDELGRASTGFVAGPALGPVTVEARGGGIVVLFQLTIVGRTPVVSAVGFVNGASFAPGWVPGSTASIFGVGLMEGVEGIVFAPFPFPTTLRNVQVLVAGEPAPIFGLANVNGQEQINLQVPVGTTAPSGEVSVTVINNGRPATFGVRTFIIQPGVFEVPLPGGRVAAALHPDFSLVTEQNPALPGQAVQLFVSGIGQTDPPFSTNEPGPIPPLRTIEEPIVTLDGAIARVLGSFYAPTLVSVFQINFVVPAGIGPGLVVMQVNVGGVRSQEVFLPVGEGP